MTRAHLNWPAVVVFALCAGLWAGAAESTYKLGKIYEHRGPQGFRHALVAKLEHRLGLEQPRTSSIGANPADA